MAPSIPALNNRVRQVLLRTVTPFAFRAAGAFTRKFESRARRTAALERHCGGHGIEIGAAAAPATVPPGCRVTYVDKYPLDVLRRDPELRGLLVQQPDVLDSAESLASLGDESQRFVIGFSIVEHVQSPLHMLASFRRVLTPGGVAIISAPDKRHYEPDRTRPLTTFEHLVRDYDEGPHVSFDDHIREVGTVQGLRGSELDAFVETLRAADGHHHFHVWDSPSFLDFLVRADRHLGLSLEVVEFASYGHETLAVLRRAR